MRRLPPGLFTGVVTVAVLWLTLAPEPLGEDAGPLIPGMDKFGHFMMFGGLTVAVCIDLWLKHRLSLGTMLVAAFVVSLFGGGIELIQDGMNVGRGAEWADWLADIIGAFFWGWLTRMFYK